MFRSPISEEEGPTCIDKAMDAEVSIGFVRKISSLPNILLSTKLSTVPVYTDVVLTSCATSLVSQIDVKVGFLRV